LCRICASIAALFFCGALGCKVVAAAEGTPPMKSIMELNVKPMTTEGVSLRTLLAQVSQETGAAICAEDVLVGNQGVLGAMRIDLRSKELLNLADFLDMLARRHPSLSWFCQDGVVLVRAKKACNIKDNPFSATVDGFVFKGTYSELLTSLSRRVASFVPDIELTSADRVDETQVYNLEFESAVPVRTIFNVLAREYGLRWWGTVKTAPTRLHETADSIGGWRLIGTVILRFTAMGTQPITLAPLLRSGGPVKSGDVDRNGVPLGTSRGDRTEVSEQVSEVRQGTDADTGPAWLHIVLGFVGAAAVGAVGMWLLLRRRSGG